MMNEKCEPGPLRVEEVYVLSRADAIEFCCPRPWACISIATEQGHFAEISEANRVGLLQVAFADLEQEPSQLTLELYPQLRNSLFDTACADRILDFADQITGHVSVLMIHCALGQSRSPAVAAALLGIAPSSLDGASPNRLVFKTLQERKQNRPGWTGFPSAPTARLLGSEFEPRPTPVPGEAGVQWMVANSRIAGV